jgi:hypothetical protein
MLIWPANSSCRSLWRPLRRTGNLFTMRGCFAKFLPVPALSHVHHAPVRPMGRCCLAGTLGCVGGSHVERSASAVSNDLPGRFSNRSRSAWLPYRRDGKRKDGLPLERALRALKHI